MPDETGIFIDGWKKPPKIEKRGDLFSTEIRNLELRDISIDDIENTIYMKIDGESEGAIQVQLSLDLEDFLHFLQVALGKKGLIITEKR